MKSLTPCRDGFSSRAPGVVVAVVSDGRALSGLKYVKKAQPAKMGTHTMFIYDNIHLWG